MLNSTHISFLYYCRREALQHWKQKLGGKATYQNLITAFERSFHYDFADFVRNMIIGNFKDCVRTAQVFMLFYVGSNINAAQSNTSTQNEMEVTMQRSEMSRYFCIQLQMTKYT